MRTEKNRFPFPLRPIISIAGVGVGVIGVGVGVGGPKVRLGRASGEFGGLGRTAISGGSCPARGRREILASDVVGETRSGRNSAPETAARHKKVKSAGEIRNPSTGREVEILGKG